MRMTWIVLSVIAVLAVAFLAGVALGLIDLDGLRSLLDDAVEIRNVKI